MSVYVSYGDKIIQEKAAKKKADEDMRLAKLAEIELDNTEISFGPISTIEGYPELGVPLGGYSSCKPGESNYWKIFPNPIGFIPGFPGLTPYISIRMQRL